jgi:hypothetical protein
MINKYGEATLITLDATHNQPVKLDRFWLEEKIEYYQSKLK